MLATQTEVSDGTLNIINVGIEFFNQSDISVSLNQADPLVLGVDYVWSASTTIQFLPTAGVPGGLVPNGVEVLLRRDTKNDDMYNKYDGGAPFSRLTLDENFEQLLRLSQEFAEGLGLDGLRNNLNMNGYRITQVGDPIADADAATKGYVDGQDAALTTELNRTIRAPSPELLLPLAPAADRVGKLLSFDSMGNPIAVLPSSGSALELELRLADTDGVGMIGYGATPLSDFLAKLRDPVATDAGVSLVGKGVRWFSTIAELRTAAVGTSGVAYVAEEGRCGFFKVDETVLVDNNINQYVSSAGVGFRRMYDGPINVRWAGAKCDKVTDDTAAIQQVIDYCATFTDWPAIEIPGPALLLGTLVVNREVITFTDRAEWRIYGTGGTGGLHRVDASTTMFSSTLPMVNDPLCAWLTFVDMRFTCPDRSLNATILSKNFLQMKFINCYFLRVRLGTTDKYWQTFNFDHCNFRYTCSGFLHSSNTGYDIHYVGCVSEYGGGYLNVFTQHLYSFSWVGGLHEGALGGLLIANGVEGALVDGSYFEFNDQPTIDLRGVNTNKSVSITGNFFATSPTHLGDANYYEIMWGSTTGAVSTANNQNNGRLHDNSSMGIAGLDSRGDTAAITLYKSPLLVTRSSGTWTPVAVGGAVTVTSATYAREGNLMHVSFTLVFPAGGVGAGCTISGLPLPATSPIVSGSVGYADLAGEVILLGGSSAPNATSSSFNICKNKQALRYTYAELNGVQVAGAFTYRI